MIYSDLHASVLRFCAEFAEAHNVPKVVNLDAYGEESDLPETDFLGMSGLSAYDEDVTVECSVMIGISTRDDTNLFRMSKIAAALFERLAPRQRVTIVDAESGAEAGWMIALAGTRLLPVSGGKTRLIQFVQVEFVTSRGYKPE